MTDTNNNLTCPACDKMMTKVYIENSDINVDICLDGCGGILFDNRELEKVDEQHENADEIFAAIKGKTFEPVNQDEIRICPICNNAMVKQGSGYGDVEIDVCNVCGAKFLDNGELEKIRELSANQDQYKEEINKIVDSEVAMNDVQIGGKYGAFAKTHFINIGARNIAENFVRKILEIM